MDRDATSSLATFIYILLRDHVPFGVVEQVVRGYHDYYVDPEPVIADNEHLMAYAREVAEQLLPDEAPLYQTPTVRLPVDTETTGPGVVPDCLGCQTSMVPHRFDCPNSPEVQILAARMASLVGSYSCHHCGSTDPNHKCCSTPSPSPTFQLATCAQCGQLETAGHVCCRPPPGAFDPAYSRCSNCGFSNHEHSHDCPYYGRTRGDL